jgi:uncharacterized tellurite resistance protein B-like protein
MFKQFKDWLSLTLTDEQTTSSLSATDSKMQAVAALMIEIIALDGVQHEAERQLLRQCLSNQFGLTGADVDKLVQQAEAAHGQATDFYPFTAAINEQFSYEQKVELIADLWSLAQADGHIDELEQHMIRKLASLLYVSHKDFIATKISVVG